MSPKNIITLKEKTKLKIAVLLGGFSSEREISLRSGKAVANALASLGHEVIEIDVKDEVVAELDSIKIDVAFIALHGKFGEDGGIQKLLDAKGIPYTGSDALASYRSMDKLETKRIFKKNKIPTPAYKIIYLTTTLDELNKYAKELGYPVVLKPQAEGSSIGVTVHRNCETLAMGFNEAFRGSEFAIMEKYIPGRELTVGILEENSLPIVELLPKREFFDYVAKYQDDETKYIVDPKDLSSNIKEKIQQITLDAHNVLGCKGFSRVDTILSRRQNVYVLEVNSIPGMMERSLVPKAARAVEIEFPELCWRIVQSALKYKQK